MVALGLGELAAYKNREVLIGTFLLVCLWCGINQIYDKTFICPKRCMLGLLCIVAGYAIMSGKSMEYAENEDRFSEGLNSITGKVSDIGDTANGYALTVKLPHNGAYVLLYVKDISGIKIGNTIEAQADYIEYEGVRNEGNFDDRQYYRSVGISGRFYGSGIKIKDSGTWALKQKMYEAKCSVKKILRLIYSEEKAAVYDAMLLGEKDGIGEDIKELYKGAGIYHLCCISGTHMAVLGLGIYRVLRKRFKYTVSGIAGIAAIIMYGMFTGMMVSVTRAVIMLSVRIAADMLGRTYDMLSSLSFAAIVMIISNPYALLNSGFMLSFGAAGAVCTVIPAAEIIYTVKNPLLKSILISFGIQLSTLPVMAYYFFEIPLYGIFINIVAIPCIIYIILSGFGGVIASVADIGLGKFLAGVGSYGLGFYEKMCRAVLKLPFSEYVTGRPDIWRIVAYYAVLMAGAFMACKLCDREREFKEEYWYIRYGKVVGGISAVIVMCIILFSGRDDGFSVKYIDVGQGDSTFIKAGNGAGYLIDAGSSDIKEVGKYRIIPTLKSNGVGQVDYLIVTHTDNDHINGIRELMDEKVSGRPFVKSLVLPDIPTKDEPYVGLESKAVQNNIGIQYISAGKGWSGRDYSLECLYPDKGMGGDDKNELSVVMRLKVHKVDMMFMGDLGEEGERNLISSGRLGRCSILKAGHHGSDNSSGRDFLGITKPFVSIVSSGRGNPYGHPGREALERFGEAGSRVYRTDRDGEIMVVIQRDGFSVDTYLD